MAQILCLVLGALLGGTMADMGPHLKSTPLMKRNIPTSEPTVPPRGTILFPNVLHGNQFSHPHGIVVIQSRGRNIIVSFHELSLKNIWIGNALSEGIVESCEMNIANSILCEPTVSNTMVNSKINKINKHTEMKPRAAANIS
jgi:hypothetical protein